MAEGNLPPAIAGNFLTLLGRYEVPTLNASKFIEIGKNMTIETNSDKGCYFLNVGQDIFNPGVFHIQEAWESQELLNAHLESQIFNELVNETIAIGLISRDIYQFNGSDWTPLFVTNS
jgi:quinol monooxygenase YgiN